MTGTARIFDDDGALNFSLGEETLPLSSLWITSLWVVRDNIGQVVREDTGLTLSHARFLVALAKAKAPSTINSIGTSLEIKPNYATAIVKRLEADHLVSRRPSSTDARCIELILTPAGRTDVNAIRDAFKHYGALFRAAVGKHDYEDVCNLIAEDDISLKPLLCDQLDDAANEAPLTCGLLEYANSRLALLSDIAREHDLGLSDYRVLLAATTLTEPPRISTLSQRLHIRPNEVSVTVRHLCDKGYIIRSDDPFDRRAVRLVRSSQGFVVLASASQEAQDKGVFPPPSRTMPTILSQPLFEDAEESL